MKKIPMLERFAAQSLVESDGELIFSKEKFAELIVRECVERIKRVGILEDIENETDMVVDAVKEHFGVE